MKAKNILSIMFGIVLLSAFVSAASVTTSLFWEETNGNTLAITQGQTVHIIVSADSIMESSMTVKVEVLNSSGNVISTLLDAFTTQDSYSNYLTLLPTMYPGTGSYTFRSTVTAASGQTDSSIISLVVSSANNPPVITSTAVTSVDENTAYSYDVDATDANGDTLTYSLVQPPSWLSINSQTGLITGTAPNVTADSQDIITVVVSDGRSSAIQMYTLNVRNIVPPPPINNPPVITSTAITSVNENTAYNYDVDATDADGNTLTYSLSLITAPLGTPLTWLSIDSATGLITGTAPSVTVNTDINITISVSDGTASVTQSYVLTVVNIVVPPPVNNPPVITSNPITNINESTLYSYNVTATDADGDTLTYSMTGPSWLSIDVSTGLIAGTAPSVSVDANYNITVTVSDGTDTFTQIYTLTVVNIPGSSSSGRSSGGGIKVLAADGFEEEKYINQFAPIKISEEETAPTAKSRSFFSIILVIFWLLVLALLIVLAVLLVRRLRN